MELRKISPLTEVNRDKPWSRWEKWGKCAITYPRSTLHRTNGSCLTRNPAVRLRSDGLVYNPETEEFFQADEQMLAFLRTFDASESDSTPVQPFEVTNDPAVAEALRRGVLIVSD